MTTLGSCIAACLWDRQAQRRRHEPLHAARGRRRRRGGATALRDGAADQRDDEARRHARRRWRPRSSAAAQVLARHEHDQRRRAQHRVRASTTCSTERIPIVAKDVLDIYPRKVCFLPRERQGDGQAARQPTNAEALVPRRSAPPRSSRAGQRRRRLASTFLRPRRPKQSIMSKTRVLVVDDSALVRSLLDRDHQPRSPTWNASARRSDPYVAREMIRNLNPDVITLDVEMPRMDGLDFLEQADAAAADAGGDGVDADRARRRGHAARARARRRRLRRQAEARRRRRPAAATPRTSPTRSASPSQRAACAAPARRRRPSRPPSARARAAAGAARPAVAPRS